MDSLGALMLFSLSEGPFSPKCLQFSLILKGSVPWALPSQGLDLRAGPCLNLGAEFHLTFWLLHCTALKHRMDFTYCVFIYMALQVCEKVLPIERFKSVWGQFIQKEPPFSGFRVSSLIIRQWTWIWIFWEMMGIRCWRRPWEWTTAGENGRKETLVLWRAAGESNGE